MCVKTEGGHLCLLLTLSDQDREEKKQVHAEVYLNIFGALRTTQTGNSECFGLADHLILIFT